jgi:hypothetical protein
MSKSFEINKQDLYSFLNDEFETVYEEYCNQKNKDDYHMHVWFYCPQNDEVDQWINDWVAEADKRNNFLEFDWEQHDDWSYSIWAEERHPCFNAPDAFKANKLACAKIKLDENAIKHNGLDAYVTQSVFEEANELDDSDS